MFWWIGCNLRDTVYDIGIPSDKRILGYWHVGFTDDTDMPIIYVLVEARGEEDATSVVSSTWSISSFEFCNRREGPFTGNLFKWDEWMLSRVPRSK